MNVFLDLEYKKFINKIMSNENFALIRNGDGELAIIEGRSIQAQEGWVAPSKKTKLSKDLLMSITENSNNFYIGISCPCCDRKAYYTYRSLVNSKNITFANLWVNGNYQSFISDLNSLKRKTIIIANHRAKGKQIANLEIIKYYSVGDNCIEFWETEGESLISKIIEDYGDQNDILYLVSAGPMSGVIIHRLFKNNKNNTYLDVGSAIDTYYYDKPTRDYQNLNSSLSTKNCWMFDDNVHFDVSVVLTLYKRPNILKEQIESILMQTLKPKEILLFHDKCETDDIKVPKELVSYFNKIDEPSINIGVWGRFNFAKKAKSEYICIFDDDTIPGKRWLENCHFNMQRKEGLYGTIGILLDRNHHYPISGYRRIGWDGGCSESYEVDFVGHSWFFKRSWLDFLYMIRNDVKAFKKVGEDIGFSYVLSTIGIPTYVPPHPKNDLDLYGSIPNKAISIGTDNNALSVNSDNLILMQKVTKLIESIGWIPLYKSNPKYVSSLSYRKKKLLFFTIRKEQKYIHIYFLRIRLFKLKNREYL